MNNNAPIEDRSAAEKSANFARQRITHARRLTPLDCGCRDPWTCPRRPRPQPSIEAKLAADAHLSALGLAPRREATT